MTMMANRLGFLTGNGKAKQELSMGELDAVAVAYYVDRAIGLSSE